MTAPRETKDIVDTVRHHVRFLPLVMCSTSGGSCPWSCVHCQALRPVPLPPLLGQRQRAGGLTRHVHQGTLISSGGLEPAQGRGGLIRHAPILFLSLLSSAREPQGRGGLYGIYIRGRSFPLLGHRQWKEGLSGTRINKHTSAWAASRAALPTTWHNSFSLQSHVHAHMRAHTRHSTRAHTRDDADKTQVTTYAHKNTQTQDAARVHTDT